MKPMQITLEWVSQLTCLWFSVWKRHCRFYGGIFFSGYFRSPTEVLQNKELYPISLISYCLHYYFKLYVLPVVPCSSKQPSNRVTNQSANQPNNQPNNQPTNQTTN